MRQSTKFYAVLLCAALGFSTSIQSCKDYDDDIDGLQEQIDAVNKSIESLKKDFGALAYVKDVKWDESTRTLTITPATGNPVTYKIEDADTQDGNTKYTLETKEEGGVITITLKNDKGEVVSAPTFTMPSMPEAFDASKLTFNAEDGCIYYNGVKTGVTIPKNEVEGFDENKLTITAGEKGKVVIKYGDKELGSMNSFDPNALTVGKDGVVLYYGEPTGVTLPQVTIPGLTITEVKDAAGTIIGYTIKYGENEPVNLKLISEKLQSLVFMPELYYQGIEAMSANTFFYNVQKLKHPTLDANKDQADDAATDGDKYSITPNLVAKYHMNPSNAAVSGLKKENMFLICEDKVYTKAGENKIEITDFSASNGILTVQAGINSGLLKDIEEDGKVTTLALQVGTKGAKGDTLITSDYAAVKAMKVKNLKIADAQKGLVDLVETHFYTTAAEAIKEAPQFELRWNNADGIDVAELVATHADRYSIDENAAVHCCLDKNAATDEIKAYGLKYEYGLVGYFDGVNKTSQSAHAAMEGSILRAQATSGGQQQDFGAEQNRSTVGRMPLVRVTLVDTATNNVAAVAYIKFRITDKEKENKATVIDPFVFGQNFTANCENKNIILNLLWDQVEEKILANKDINMSKAEFMQEYKLDGLTWGEQFDKAGIDAKPVASNEKIGKVSFPNIDDEDHQTNILRWIVNSEEAYKLFVEHNEFSVIVRFVKDNGNNTYHYVYVTLTWHPKELNVKPTGTIDNGIKFSKVWFKHDTKENGFDDVHFGVAVPTSEDGKGECTFTNDLLDKFSERKLIISGIDAIYEDFADELLTKTFTFVTEPNKEVKGCDGKTYILTADGTDLIATEKGKPANKEVIAKLSGENGKVLNSIVTYQEGTIAKAILNKAYETVDGALTAKVAVNAVNGCGKPVTLSNNEFFVKFMRPITINKGGDKFLEDGVAGGSELKIADILSFIDWRDNAFTKKNCLFNYYKVSAIKINTAAIKISDGGLLTTVYPNAKIEFTVTGKLGLDNLGTLTWKNNSGTVIKEMTLIVPVEVEYAWGTITKDIEVKVKKTQGN